MAMVIYSHSESHIHCDDAGQMCINHQLKMDKYTIYSYSFQKILYICHICVKIMSSVGVMWRKGSATVLWAVCVLL